MIGTRIGPYEITGQLGAGGMGVVYRAKDERLGREVAVKVLSAAFAADPDRVRRFEQEARAAAALGHPNILAVHDVGAHDGSPFLVTELLEGETLRERIEAGGLTVRKAVELAGQIARGLAAAHERGIVHRDLKPDNVFVTQDGTVKLLDFGLAKLTQRDGEAAASRAGTVTTDTAAVVGTVGYMSPEQLRAQEVTPATDIFAFGCVLYEMLSGRRAFAGQTPADTISAILSSDPPPLTTPGRERTVPPSLEKVVLRCLEKRPQDRFGSVKDLTFALESAWAGAELLSERTSRRRVIVALCVTAPILLLGVFLSARFLSRRATADAPGRVPRIAVLPFKNLGPADDQFLADGITEEIISRLAAVSGVRVISHESTVQYRGQRPSLRQIGEELDVSYVLEGTLRWDHGSDGPGRVRITPELVRVDDDSSVWSDRYERGLEDLFEVQSRIAESVVIHVEAVVLDSEREGLAVQPTKSLEAYRAYLLGTQYLGMGEIPEDDMLAIASLERAVRLDPEFAIAFAALARGHAKVIHLREDLSPRRVASARQAAVDALALGRELPEVRRDLGYYYYWAERNYDLALSELSLAVTKRPSDAGAWAGMAWVMRRQGRFLDSVEPLEKALSLDPWNATDLWNLGGTFAFLREYEKAVGLIERALELDAQLIDPYYRLARIYRLWDGEPERARAALSPIRNGTHPVVVFAWVDQEMYERRWRDVLRRLQQSPLKVFSLPRQLMPSSLIECECRIALGEHVEAQEACDKARLHLEELLGEDTPDPRVYAALGKTYALMGRREDAILRAEEAVALCPISKDAYDGQYFEIYLAEVYALAGEPDRAIARLRFLLSIPSLISIGSLRFDPRWDKLRDDAGFRVLLEGHSN